MQALAPRMRNRLDKRLSDQLVDKPIARVSLVRLVRDQMGAFGFVEL